MMYIDGPGNKNLKVDNRCQQPKVNWTISKNNIFLNITHSAFD